MVDYSMGDEEWNTRKGELDEWYEANPDHMDHKVNTDGILTIGELQPQLRKMHWSAIASYFAWLGEHSPVGPEVVIVSDDEC